jgi:hypothetical protein
MHDEGQSSTNSRITDPLRGAPPPGRWVLLHGPLASAVLDLGRNEGRAGAPPADLPAIPDGFPPPGGESLGAFLLEKEGRRFFMKGEVHNHYVSCFLCHLPASG